MRSMNWVGGWTTSIRMHEEQRLDCIFGCKDEPDSLGHYLCCAPLWMIVGEVLGQSPHFLIAERIGIRNPSVFSLTCLALAFHGFHYSKSLLPLPPLSVQTACSHACKSFKLQLNL